MLQKYLCKFGAITENLLLIGFVLRSFNLHPEKSKHACPLLPPREVRIRQTRQDGGDPRLALAVKSRWVKGYFK